MGDMDFADYRTAVGNALLARADFFRAAAGQFPLGFTLAAWSEAPIAAVRTGREFSLALWLLAMVASLSTATRSNPAIAKGR